MGKAKEAAKQKAYLADGTEVELLAIKGKVLHEDGTEAEAWVTQSPPAEEAETGDDGQEKAAG